MPAWWAVRRSRERSRLGSQPESGKRGTLAQTLDLEDLLAPGMVTAMAQRLASRLRDASASTAPATVDPPEPGEALGAEPAEDDVSSPAGGSQ